MTTHDQQTVNETTEHIDPETSRPAVDMPAAQNDSVVHEAETQSAPPELGAAEPETTGTVEPQMETVPRTAGVQPSDDELFDADSSDLRSRWDDIQAAFVDDPSGCVKQADGLVEEVMNGLTSRFADTRSHLEAQWARGETASTEDLRVALTRYREFFNRLLAV